MKAWVDSENVGPQEFCLRSHSGVGVVPASRHRGLPGARTWSPNPMYMYMYMYLEFCTVFLYISNPNWIGPSLVSQLNL